MATAVDICNIALSILGTGQTISNLTTERTQEALACRLFFEIDRDTTLRDFPWSFAKRTRTLELVEENPDEEWAFSYREPSDCIRFNRIQSGARNDTPQTRVPYSIRGDESGGLIYTDKANAIGEYTVRLTDATKYPSDFSMALACKLASHLAPRLTKGDPFKLGNYALSLYQSEIDKAKANSLNEEQDELPPESEYVRSRE